MKKGQYSKVIVIDKLIDELEHDGVTPTIIDRVRTDADFASYYAALKGYYLIPTPSVTDAREANMEAGIPIVENDPNKHYKLRDLQRVVSEASADGIITEDEAQDIAKVVQGCSKQLKGLVTTEILSVISAIAPIVVWLLKYLGVIK